MWKRIDEQRFVTLVELGCVARCVGFTDQRTDAYLDLYAKEWLTEQIPEKELRYWKEHTIKGEFHWAFWAKVEDNGDDNNEQG